MMIGPLILLAASAMATSTPASAEGDGAASFQPSSKVSARATVSIRVVSGVSFGASHDYSGNGAARRTAPVTDADGSVRSAELLEFQ